MSVLSLLARFGTSISVSRIPPGLQLSFSADFVTGNQIAMDVGVGSTVTAIAPVDFTTDSPTTLGLLADAIAAVAGVASAAVSGSIIVVQNPESVSLSGIAVTGGASQPAAAIAGAFVNGVWTPAPATTLPMQAIAMQRSLRMAEEIQILKPEGVRTKAQVYFLTGQPLYTAGEGTGRQADVITWAGIQYQVQEVSTWNQGPLAHYEILASKIEQDG